MKEFAQICMAIAIAIPILQSIWNKIINVELTAREALSMVNWPVVGILLVVAVLAFVASLHQERESDSVEECP